MTSTALSFIIGSNSVEADGSKSVGCSYHPLPKGDVCYLRIDVVGVRITFIELCIVAIFTICFEVGVRI